MACRLSIVVSILSLPPAATAADLITDGDMEQAGIANWPHTDIAETNFSVKAMDQASSGQSLKGTSQSGNGRAVSWSNGQNLGTVPAAQKVTLSLWYGAQWNVSATGGSGTVATDVRQDAGPWVTIWDQELAPSTSFQAAVVSSVDASAFFATAGSYELRVRFEGVTGNTGSASIDVWWDDVVLDVSPPDPLFADGFESGDTSAWSLSAP